MITREEVAYEMLRPIYEASLDRGMDAHDIVSDAFRIADAFIKIRDAGEGSNDGEHSLSRPIGFNSQHCATETVK